MRQRISPPQCSANFLTLRVIVERVFSLPGAGALLVDSIGARDYPVVQSMTLIFATLVILVNLATDVIYTFLDPRVRLG